MTCRTSYDYTHGKLDELTTIVIESGASLFVSAVGVPPKAIVDRLHAAGVLYMNMIGHPKHVKKCVELGVDLIITGPAVSAHTTCELARLALQDADGLPAHPQVPALTAHVRRLLGALLASPAPHGLVA